jgi:hypothetical protein
MAPGAGVQRPPLRAVLADVPLATWLLLVGAAATVPAHLMGANLLYPYESITLGQAFSIVLSARSFLLAAALVAGAVAWPGGRRWLLAAALVFALGGLLDLGFYAWLWSRGGYAGLDGDFATLTPLFNVRALVSQAVEVVATILVAVGLWRASPRGAWPDARRIRVMGGIGVIGVLAVAAPLAWLGPLPPQPAEAIVSTMLASLLMGATAGVALGAVAAMPRTGWLPELVVASGAGLEVVTTAWAAWLSFAIGGMQNIPPEWSGLAFTLPGRLGVIGVLLMVVGLAMGHLAGEAGKLAGGAVAQDESELV